MTHTWDLFISHASEDKAEVVLPLADTLRRAGIRVWLDRQQLELGDSLRAKIDAGLAHSRFGIVVLSESFFRKHWPQRELDGLVAREHLGNKVVLPIWHGVDQRRVAEFSPTLAGILAVSTADGIEQVAAEITRVVLSPAHGSPSVTSPTRARRLVELLESDPTPATIAEFLKRHSAILENVFGNSQGSQVQVNGPVQLGELTIHLAVGQLMLSTQRWRSHLVQFAPTSDQIITSDGSPTPAVADVLQTLHSARRWIANNVVGAKTAFAGLSPSFLGIAFAGRRSMLDAGRADLLGEFNEQSVGVVLRTYDHLIEAALALEHHTGGSND